MKRVTEYLEALNDPRREAVLRFHRKHEALAKVAKGSAVKHQAWAGGYLDHLGEIFRIAEKIYISLTAIRNVPYTFDQVLLVLYFHDIEKLWKYSTGLPEGFDKYHFLFETLSLEYRIVFSDAERNALEFVHGEASEEYSPTVRLMNGRASICHAADNLSARLWFDQGEGLG